ncbi:hypothetical protein D3C73_1411410 [compost metagenome]
MKGIIKTTSSRNGNDRTMFTNPLRIMDQVAFSRSWPLAVRYSMVPSGSPSNMAAMTEIPTIRNVSPTASAIWIRKSMNFSSIKEKSNIRHPCLPKQQLPVGRLMAWDIPCGTLLQREAVR